VCEDASVDARIIDVTSEFTGSHNLTDTALNSDWRLASASKDTAAGDEDENAGCSAVERLCEPLASIAVVTDECGPSDATHPSDADAAVVIAVALVLGGMDTAGEIFDDCLMMRLKP